MNMLNDKKMINSVLTMVIIFSLFIIKYKPSFSIAMILFFLYLIYNYIKEKSFDNLILDRKLLNGYIIFFSAMLLAAIMNGDLN